MSCYVSESDEDEDSKTKRKRAKKEAKRNAKSNAQAQAAVGAEVRNVAFAPLSDLSLTCRRYDCTAFSLPLSEIERD